MHITFQNQLEISNYQEIQNMWNVTVEKRPLLFKYEAISKLLSLTLLTVVAKLSPPIEKNWEETNLLYFKQVPPRTKKEILRIDLVHFCLNNIKISLKVVNLKCFWADTVLYNASYELKIMLLLYTT